MSRRSCCSGGSLAWGDGAGDNAGMLPDGLQWVRRHQYEKSEPAALALDGQIVAMLLECSDGSWFATLERHQPLEAPLVTRPCTSFEAGRRGCEIWATRHLGRLRAELAQSGVRKRMA